MTRVASSKTLRLIFASSIVAIAGLTSACTTGTTQNTTTERSSVVTSPGNPVPLSSTTTVTKTQTVTP
jgi:hypothetical protein